MIKELYIKKESLIHKLNFWTKFLCLLLFLPLAGFLAPVKILPVLIIVFFYFLISSKTPFKKFWSLTKFYIIPITIGITILSLFFYKGPLEQRLLQSLILAIRFIILISLGVLFAMVTSPIEIPAGLLKVRIPHKYGITVMVAFRMLPLISQKIKSIIDAQRARGAEIKISFKNLLKLPPLFISLMIPILHSTLETSVKLSDTLISRGYNPEAEITTPPTKFKKTDYTILLFSVIILVLSVVKI